MPTWNLDDIHTVDETDALLAELKEKSTAFARYRDSLKADMPIKDFMVVLQELETVVKLSHRLGSRVSLELTTNTTDPDVNAAKDKIMTATTECGNDRLFFSLWFKSLSEEEAQRFIDAAGPYKYKLEEDRASIPYTLKESEEQILNLKYITSVQSTNKIYDITTGRLKFEYEGREYTQEEMGAFRQSPDRTKRKAFYDTVYGGYGREQDVVGELYKILVNDWHNTNIKIRKFEKPISVRNHANDVTDKAVDALLNTVKKNVSVFQDYFRLKSSILGEKLDRYDLYAPFDGSSKEYSYDECREITLDTFKEFDPRLHEMAQQIFDAEHVHSELTDNKRSGAYCNSYTQGGIPYIFLNFTGTQSDLFTMVHEFGHGVHGLAAKDQTEFTFHSSLPMAETASLFAELLLSHRLRAAAADDEKIKILMRDLDGQYSSIVRQSFFVMFENAAHEAIVKGATISDLNKLYLENLNEQFGDALPVKEVFQYEWSYIPHIHHVPFYCYAYSFGYLLVLSLYKMYEEQGESFKDTYLKILSYGGSKAPADILNEVGINIEEESFWQGGFDVIREQVDELRRLIQEKEASA